MASVTFCLVASFGDLFAQGGGQKHAEYSKPDAKIGGVTNASKTVPLEAVVVMYSRLVMQNSHRGHI